MLVSGAYGVNVKTPVSRMAAISAILWTISRHPPGTSRATISIRCSS